MRKGMILSCFVVGAVSGFQPFGTKAPPTLTVKSLLSSPCPSSVVLKTSKPARPCKAGLLASTGDDDASNESESKPNSLKKSCLPVFLMVFLDLTLNQVRPT